MGKIITILITIILIGILLFLFIKIIPISYEQQFFILCVSNDWGENVSFSGDLSGEINCKDYWNENYADGKWAEKCSTWFWSKKISCHDLCNVDCEFYNKENKQNMCVC